nr:MAG TPA: hypothetical protein [Caudoviricetes sp.]
MRTRATQKTALALATRRNTQAQKRGRVFVRQTEDLTDA